MASSSPPRYSYDVSTFSHLQELEHILESDPFIDEIGFIHPAQLATLMGEADSHSSSDPERLKFFSRDHKLGISTQILFPLYEQAKKAFFDEMTRCKRQISLLENARDVSSLRPCSSSHDELDLCVMKHSKALLLLSPDFGTAWNARRVIALKNETLSTYMDELQLSELILSYSAKSEQAWSHRRWVIKRIAGKVPNLQEIVRKESELVEKIAERAKMNYRAWNHRCWLVSYMTGEQVFYELKKSKAWAGLHVADSSCFHYRRRLMMKMLEDLHCKNATAPEGSSMEIYESWKEELAWNETLIKRYIGREALWLYRRFLSLNWLRHFTTTSMNDDGPNIFIDNELHLVESCSTVPNNDFDDFQAQAMHSTTYILWLAKQMPGSQAVLLREKLNLRNMKALLNELCPQRAFFSDLLKD